MGVLGEKIPRAGGEYVNIKVRTTATNIIVSLLMLFFKAASYWQT
jgi:hypothetical protein